MELDKLDREYFKISSNKDATLPLKELAEKVHSSVGNLSASNSIIDRKRGYYQTSGSGIAKGSGRGISVL